MVRDQGTLLVDGRIDQANVALGKASPAVLASQATVVIANLVNVARVGGLASHRTIVPIVVWWAVYFYVTVLASVAF